MDLRRRADQGTFKPTEPDIEPTIMDLEVRLYNDFKRFAPGKKHVFRMACAAGDTVGNVFNALNIPQDAQAVILLNGRRALMETPILPQSRLVVFAPVSGG